MKQTKLKYIALFVAFVAGFVANRAYVAYEVAQDNQQAYENAMVSHREQVKDFNKLWELRGGKQLDAAGDSEEAARALAALKAANVAEAKRLR